MTSKPPHTIAGDDHEEESRLLLGQEESSSEESFQLKIIFSAGRTKTSLDETRTYINAPESAPPAGSINSTTNPDDITNSRRKRLILISLLVLFMVLIEFGMTFISTPLYQIQEDIICRQFLPATRNGSNLISAPSPDSSTSTAVLMQSPQNTNTTSIQDSSPSREECKTSPPTQSEFSILTSWSFVLQLLPGLVMAVPMGLLADKHGRTLVMALSMAGMTLNFGFSVLVCSYPNFFGGSLRWTWAGSLFNFLGGGMTVFSAMVFSMLSDVSGEGERSTAFSYLTAGMHAGAIVAPPTTYYLMKVLGDWATIYLGLSILFLAVIFAICLPETLETQPQEDGPNSIEDIGKIILTRENILPKIKTSLLRFREFLKLLETNLLLLLASILLTTFGRDAQTVLLQYVTVKFGWSWGEAGLIQSIQSITTLTLLTVLLPLASYFLLRQHENHPSSNRSQRRRRTRFRKIMGVKGPQSRDLTLARISISLQTLGAFLTGLAPSAGVLIPSVVVSSLGQGFNLLVRGLMTSLLISSSSHDFHGHGRGSHAPAESSDEYTSTSGRGNINDEEDPICQVPLEVANEANDPEAGENTTSKEFSETASKGEEKEKDNHTALLNSTIAWVETAGAMIATPLLAGSFRLGLSWSGIWTGLPFFLAGCLFLSATLIVLFVRIRDHVHDHTTPPPNFPREGDGDLEGGRQRQHERYTPVNQHA